MTSALTEFGSSSPSRFGGSALGTKAAIEAAGWTTHFNNFNHPYYPTGRRR